MSRLVILSERNVLGYLNKNGIYPAEFYTDIDKFKDMATFFDNTTIVYLHFGCGRFSRKVLRDTLSTLQLRMEDGEDGGIADLIILSSVPFGINEFEKYYLFDTSPFILTEVGKKGRKGADTDLLTVLGSCSYNIRDVKVFLDVKDFGINTSALNAVRLSEQSKSDLVPLIQIPRFDI